MVALVEAGSTERDALRAALSDYLVELAEVEGVPNAERSDDGSPAYEWFDRYWVDDDRLPFLVNVADEVAGFCLIRVVKGGWSIAEFGIGPAWRRKGVGRRAVAQLAVAAQRAGAAHLHADVHSWNQRALRFWTSCGFHSVDEEGGVISTRLPLDDRD